MLYIRSNSGKLVPLDTVAKVTETVGPLTVNHINGLPSVTISFSLVGVPLGTALDSLQKLASEELPPTVSGNVQGSANVFRDTFSNLVYLLLITFFIIYVVLGILYENTFHPITVMSTLPPAALGGLLTLLLFNQPLSLYSFVGIIMLLGIVMKNGIIMVDFANAARASGKTAEEAIHYACTTRYRPILMTTLAALMGAVPIAIGLGGLTAQSYRPLGLVIVGGLLFSQVLTLFLTPVVYLYVEKMRERVGRKKKNFHHREDGEEGEERGEKKEN
jgi:HAE1 family hydrophobic/amphiphilic exporter-1